MAFGVLLTISDREAAVMHTRKLYLEANQELIAANAKIAELQAELSSRDRDLVSTKTDCMLSCAYIFSESILTLRSVAAVGKGEIEAINNLKAAHELITSSFENDLLMLQNKHKTLSTDFDEQKSQLIDALLSKDKLGKELVAAKDGSGSAESGQYQAIVESEAKHKEVSSLASCGI